MIEAFYNSNFFK